MKVLGGVVRTKNERDRTGSTVTKSQRQRFDYFCLKVVEKVKTKIRRGEKTLARPIRILISTSRGVAGMRPKSAPQWVLPASDSD